MDYHDTWMCYVLHTSFERLYQKGAFALPLSKSGAPCMHMQPKGDPSETE